MDCVVGMDLFASSTIQLPLARLESYSAIVILLGFAVENPSRLNSLMCREHAEG